MNVKFIAASLGAFAAVGEDAVWRGVQGLGFRVRKLRGMANRQKKSRYVVVFRLVSGNIVGRWDTQGFAGRV